MTKRGLSAGHWVVDVDVDVVLVLVVVVVLVDDVAPPLAEQTLAPDQ